MAATWIKLYDDFATHPKVIGLSDGAFRLYISGLCYASGHLTDGALAGKTWKVLGGTQRQVDELVGAVLWEPSGAGYAIHDYLKVQRSRERVERIREVTSIAGASSATKRSTKRSTDRPTERSTFSSENVLSASVSDPDPFSPPEEGDPGDEEAEKNISFNETLPSKRELMATLELRIGSRIWQREPELREQFEGYIAVHGVETVAEAVNECYRHRENGRTLQPYPRNVARFLPGEDVEAMTIGGTFEERQRRYGKSVFAGLQGGTP